MSRFVVVMNFKLKIISYQLGDSGSPLVVHNESVGEILVGITSYVDLDTTCDPDTAGPVVFMRISYFMNWIEEKTGLKF